MSNQTKKKIDWAETIGALIAAWIVIGLIIGVILIATGHS